MRRSLRQDGASGSARSVALAEIGEPLPVVDVGAKDACVRGRSGNDSCKSEGVALRP